MSLQSFSQLMILFHEHLSKICKLEFSTFEEFRLESLHKDIQPIAAQRKYCYGVEHQPILREYLNGISNIRKEQKDR